MSPIINIPHVWARANTASPVMSNLEPNTPSTRPTHPSAQSASLPRALVVDSSTPPLPPPPPAVPSAMKNETPSAHSIARGGPGMTLGTKIGLGMIPVMIAFCAVCIFTAFWWRRRKARKARQTLQTPPPAPEKDYMIRLPSLDSTRRGSKIFNMSAFSTHVSDGRHREAQVLGQSREYIRMVNQDQEDDGATPKTPARSISEKGRSGRDSPIDGASPFRLTHSELARRSLGSEISELWPSPPPTAWVRRQGILDSLPESRFGRDMSRRSSQRSTNSNYKRMSDASSAF